MKIETDYKELILKIPIAWAMLKNHRHQRTFGIDHESISTFSKAQKANLLRIKKQLLEKKYRFKEMRPAPISKRGKKRTILIATVEDRIVCKAILSLIEPKFNAYNSNCDFSREVTFKSRTKKPKFKGVPLAVYAIQEHMTAGYTWIVEADIKKFFDNVPKKEILKIVAQEISDKNILKLIKDIVKFKVDSESQDTSLYKPYKGIAQGSSISPLLASVYLFNFDEFIKKTINVKLVRYVDDFILLCRDEETAQKIHDIAKVKLGKMGLDIHGKDVPDEKGRVKTRIINSTHESFEFLGLNFNGRDVDIAREKKDELILDTNEIIKGQKGQIYKKTLRIERKLHSFIRQYRHPHYTRTKQSLIALTRRIHQEIEKDFLNELKSVFGPNYYNKLDPVAQKKLLDIIGVNINKLVK